MWKTRNIVAVSLIAVLLVLILVGCGNNNDNLSSNTDDTQQNEDLVIKKENTQEDTALKEKTDPKEIKIKSIKKGEVVTIEDYCEFVIDDIKFAKEIIPPNPSEFYTYYEIKEPDTIFLDTVITIKSLLESGRFANEFASVKAIYDNKYEYETFSTAEESGGSNFTYTNIVSIEPLKKKTLHFLAEVPDEVASMDRPVSVLIVVDGKEFKYDIE